MKKLLFSLLSILMLISLLSRLYAEAGKSRQLS